RDDRVPGRQRVGRALRARGRAGALDRRRSGRLRDMSAQAPIAPAARSPYIAGPVFDWVFFLLPPIASLALGALIAGTGFAEHRFWFAGKRATGASLMLGVLVNAHLVAVVARSHLNPEVFRRHPVRFVVVPLAALAAMMTSLWAVAVATVLVVFWD